MKIWCVTGMCILKVVSSETNLGVEGLSAIKLFLGLPWDLEVLDRMYNGR